MARPTTRLTTRAATGLTARVATRLTSGDLVPDFAGATARGGRIAARDLRGSWVLLQFHRFASCPACFVSVSDFARRYRELQDEGLRLIAFFYSPPEELARSFEALDPDFDIIGDADRTIFDRFGVERSVRKFLSLRAWMTAARGWSKGAAFDPVSNLNKQDTAGVPADFLIDDNGVVRHAHYGIHAADSMSVDDVLNTYRRLGPSNEAQVVAQAKGWNPR